MIGIDVLEIERIKNIADDEKKLKKIFTENEIKYFNNFKNKYEHICGFFCAKEAIIKAVDIESEISFLDIEICHKNNGKPYAKFGTKFNYLNKKNIDISISHSKTIATAICLII